MGGYAVKVTTETRIRKGTMSAFRTLAKIILIFVLSAAGCTPSQDAKSTPRTTAPSMVVEGIVQSVSISVGCSCQNPRWALRQ
jgi:uncharacterized lipoprotein YajG